MPDAEIIRSLVKYNPETGVIVWQERNVELFNPVNGRSAENCCAVWNAKYAGKIAGTRKQYMYLKLLGTGYMAHRIAWKWMTGEEPPEIDHINRDKFDNRWSNLRSVTRAQNMRNKGQLVTNTSGYKHITWSKKLSRWVVQMQVPGKGQRQVAWETNLTDAVVARGLAYERYGYKHD